MIVASRNRIVNAAMKDYGYRFEAEDRRDNAILRWLRYAANESRFRGWFVMQVVVRWIARLILK